MLMGGDAMDFAINGRILELRKSLKLSQTDFGKAIGVSRGVINNIDLNIVDATTKPLLLQQISKTFNVSLRWIETGEGEMFNALSRDEQIAQFIGATLSTEDDKTPDIRSLQNVRGRVGSTRAAYQPACRDNKKREQLILLFFIAKSE